MKPFFEVVDHEGTRAYRANAHAQSAWGADHVAGPAVVGLLAQVLQEEQGVDGFLPARTTFELLRAFRSAVTVVRTEVVRAGSRIKVARAEALQDDVLVASAVFVQYKTSENAPGGRWRSEETVPFPPDADADPEPVSWFHSESVGWSSKLEDQLNADRSTAWWRPLEITDDRALTPYVRAIVAAEWTSLVTNLGTDWVGYINGDLTVALSRLPRGEWIGVQETSHLDTDGIAVGTSTIADRDGPIGAGTVTAVNNVRAFS